ncbi:unnamed protein product [Closterium sp. NIES-54]
MGLPDHIDVLLPRLHKLTVRKCDLVCLPKSFASLSCLQTLVLYSCGLVTLPSNFGDLPALKLLLLDQLPLSELPSSFFQLNSLESLFLAECDKLPRRPARFCGLTALKAFCITHSSFVLPEDVGALESLEALMLTDYGSPFPASFTELSSLTSLELDNCELGVQLPEALGELTSLRELKISVSHIRTLPVSLLQLTRFQTLRIIACSSLSEVPPSWICSWGLRGCRYCALRKLSLDGVRMRCWPEESGRLPCLEQLERLRLSGTSELPNPLPLIPHLRHLATRTLQENMAAALLQLRELELNLGQNVEELPGSILELTSLTSLTLEAHSLASLPQGMSHLCLLRKLELIRCAALQHLPECLSQLQ